MVGPVKAKFKVLDGANKLLNVSAVVGGAGIPCIFNPTDFTIQRSVNYAQHKIPGRDRPVLQFVSGEAEVMSFSLLFDTFLSDLKIKEALRIQPAADGALGSRARPPQAGRPRIHCAADEAYNGQFRYPRTQPGGIRVGIYQFQGIYHVDIAEVHDVRI